MQKSRSLVTGLSFFFLALLLTALAARFWLSDRAYQFTGPTHIAAGPDHVYLFAAGDIYRFSHQGELLSVAPPGLTGLRDDPIDLRVLPGGELMIAEQRPAVVRICEVDSWTCRTAAAVPESLIERQLKVLPGGNDNGLLMTDARGDTLWRMDGSGGEPQELLPKGTLAGPNDLAFGDYGHIWVADTDHRRIVELLPSVDGSFLPGREHSAINHLTVGKRFYPMMLARTTDGRWWVIQAADFSQPFADLVIYDEEQGALARIDLPPDAYPTDITTYGDTVLVTDLERFTVYRVTGRTLEIGEFGDEQFHGQMAQLRERRGTYERGGTVSLAAIVLFGALMILAAVWATPSERRWTRPPVPFDLSSAASEVPKTTGIHWLERDPKIERLLKWLGLLVFIPLIVMATGALSLFVWVRIRAGPNPDPEMISKLNELGIILLLSIVLGVLIIPAIHYSLRAMKHRLGTDGKRIFIKLAEGRELAVEPTQLAFTDRAILYRQYTLPLTTGKKQSIYAPGEIQTWLAPLLRQSRRLTAMEALKHQWKNR